MDECIETLIFLQQAAEDKYTFKVTRVGHRVNNKYDQDMQLLARIAAHHACNLVEQQYKASQQTDYIVKSSGQTSAFQTLESKESRQIYEVSYWVLVGCWDVGH